MICTLHNNKVYYTDEGKGPALLFMPGPDARPLVWHNQVAELAGSFRVLRLDFSGINIDSLSVQKCVEIIDEFILFKELRQVAVIGCSVGGYLACEYALSHPNMVNSVIISSVGVTNTINDTIKHYLPDYKASKCGNLIHLLNYFLRRKDQSYFLSKYFSMLKNNQQLFNSISSLVTPLLIINGQNEKNEISRLASSLYLNNMNNIEFEIVEESDILPNVSAPDCYNIIITDFIKRNLIPL